MKTSNGAQITYYLEIVQTLFKMKNNGHNSGINEIWNKLSKDGFGLNSQDLYAWLNLAFLYLNASVSLFWTCYLVSEDTTLCFSVVL